MTTKEIVKSIGGLIAIATLCGLVVADSAGIVVFSLYDKVLLVALICSLLSIDIALESLPELRIGLTRGKNEDRDDD